jgi:hypothetical protein
MSQHRTTSQIRALDRFKGIALVLLVAILMTVLLRGCLAQPASDPSPTTAPATPSVAPAPPSPTPAEATSTEPSGLTSATPGETMPETTTPTITPPSATEAASAPAATSPTPTPTLQATPECVGPTGIDQGEVWIVGECDTLHRISQLTGIPFAALVAANPQIPDPNIIFPGQVINLPR